MKDYDNALHMMEVQGGSFVKALANCYYMADTPNKTKLRETFAEYFNNYEARFAALTGERKPRFENVYCSACGCEFGPGDHGFSHCEHHANLKGER